MISAANTFSVSASASSSASSAVTISALGSWAATATAPGTETATGSNTPTASVTPTPAQGMRINVNTLYNLTTQTINSMTVVQSTDNSMTTIVSVVVALNFAVLVAIGIIIRHRLHGSAAKAEKPLSATAPKMPVPPGGLPAPPPPPTEPKKVTWGANVANSIVKAATKVVSGATAQAPAAPAPPAAPAAPAAPKPVTAASTAPANKPAAS
jgi:2-oxoglutarate dehydrogenase E2 component (dihydrolipoamide succinyltransferase)